MKKILGMLLGSTIGIAALAGQAGAAPLEACPGAFTADGTAKVFNGGQSAVSDCQIDRGTDQSDVASIDQINTSAFFGFSDWQSNDQTQISAESSSGSWSISEADFDAFDYIIVFKDGNATSLTAFLFNEEFSSGSWSTPFTDPPFNLPGASTSHEVSHYTIAFRDGGGGGGIPVPEPAALGLLGLGIAGMAFARRRRIA